MSTPLITSAVVAWQKIIDYGFEPNGRDKEITEHLKASIENRLKSSSADINDAISKCSTDDFINCFFATAEPFVKMLTDIKLMIQRAGAEYGKKELKIRLQDGFEYDASDFKSWENIFSSCLKYIKCPDMKSKDWVILSGKFTGRKYKLHHDKEIISSDLPAPTKKQGVIYNIWAILSRMQNSIIKVDKNDAEISGEKYENPVGSSYDGFDAGIIYRLNSNFTISHVFQSYLKIIDDGKIQPSLENDLDLFFQSLGYQEFWTSADIEKLEAFISLPLWSKRHEFYSAWIAALQTDFLYNENIAIEINHNQGVIDFPFKETVVATIKHNDTVMYSEKRSAITNPQGKGRTNNVQPDYSWWSSENECILVVEVKHYKKAAKKSWEDVLADYSSAHKGAEILLVNYGPPGNINYKIPVNCQIIGNLYPGSEESINIFKKYFIKNILRHAIAIDISESMRDHINKDLICLVKSLSINNIYLINNEIVKKITSREISEIAQEINGAEDFFNPLKKILSDNRNVILITDDSGVENLSKYSEFFSYKINNYNSTKFFIFDVSLRDMK